MALRRRDKILIFKLSALLSLVRWYNIFFLALAQYLAVIFVLNDPHNWLALVLDFKVHAIVFASLFSVAGGYIINNFYDLEKDLINRPDKTLYEKILKQSTTLRLYFLFAISGSLLGSLVSFNVFLFFAAFNFALWFYSHKLKKITFIGNMMAALLSITPFFAIFLYFHLEDLVILTYVSFVLLVIFIREIIKDLEALKGDIILGYPTLPVTLGLRKTKWLVAVFTLAGLIPAGAIFYKVGLNGIGYYLALGLAGLFFSAGLLAFAEKKEHFHYLNHLYRLLIIGGIVSLIWLG
ncbi:geranylgeranylglycerol-phosphate geranylgeranyltransferase [Croceimicrobium hydrocarbonivorans]|uniref:Geranylgeranylglycerol-phosphate geranylgeranyltransferase n=1 Tax=Croceimicrobium hydrocarbonivorans TaxID=2761580 RepID=A0A7H0VAY9_9FLAO|nr:geranylgeranylglycerol-phosphate geranylgeranyltransferase [Croceimicrobium hydrocarbonivorans]QNR22887.1 geranylgeranylglycerol-phosphate geranylgeranyltransferase [Croceimicrobium hydrocarbonivorans]